jgi:hypothetical protein
MRTTPRFRQVRVLVLLLFFMAVALTGFADDRTASWRQHLEADWVLAEELASQAKVDAVITPKADAAGGCDGIKNGEWGFHTDNSRNPWWQVDLCQVQEIARVVVWNRTAAAERASKLRVLVSEDGKQFRQVYQHDGTIFLGFADHQPLVVKLSGERARFVRLALPGTSYLHLDEVEVFGETDPQKNLALNRPADQVSVSQWSSSHEVAPAPVDWREQTRRRLEVCKSMAGEDPSALASLKQKLADLPPDESAKGLFMEARRIQRRLALRNPLLCGFDTLLFTKRVPGSFNHMSDQYYGWWSKPGGGMFLLRGFTTDSPTEECISSSFREPGSFLRPTLSYDGKKVLFAWCRYYEHLAGHTNKLDKTTVPEDSFYHLFEMNIDGSDVRRITRGKYDDFDGRYLPDGRIVFLSTRRGQSLQVGRQSAAQTLARQDMPDCYVRCGGGPERPVAVYTLHTMNADGSDLVAISPFEMFEWTPEIARDGTIIYSRWDYIDRDNMPYMGLWAVNPDGTGARIVYKNYTRAPHCTFEAKPIPGSHKIVFTGSAHHSQTMGSLALLDPDTGFEGGDPIRRLTPEVVFPEAEGWPKTSYANPWPLSERFYLVAWGAEGARVPGPQGWARWHSVQRPPNGMAIYLYDSTAGSRELLWADDTIGCGDPIPVQTRERPPVIATQLTGTAAGEGRFLLSDVYRGLAGVERGRVKSLRVVAVPAKTHPTMNFPTMGITRDDPGKCVLGTVPVEEDGSAYFRVPAGVIVFFQALDVDGVAVQTMRSVSYVQPGQNLGCVGCHEPREQAPPAKVALAGLREPSRLTAGPAGSWPLRFDQLVQPVLDRHCVNCHNPKATNAVAAKLDLTPAKAYESLVQFGKPSLNDLVMAAYRRGFSVPGDGIAQRSALWALINVPENHTGARLDADTRERLLTWLDTYAQRLGHFSDAQERELIELRRAWRSLLIEREPNKSASLGSR